MLFLAALFCASTVAQRQAFIDLIVMKGTISDGQILVTLKPADIRIQEDQRACEVLDLSLQVPAHVVFLLDRSGSMGDWWKTNGLETGFMTEIRSLIAQLPEGSKLSILAFSHVVYAVDTQSRSVPASPPTPEGWRRTALYEGLHQAFAHVRGFDGRQIVVVVTDGEDNSSDLSSHDIRKELHSSRVTLHMTRVGSIPDLGYGHGILADLCHRSGGAVVPVSFDSFTKIQRNLKVLSLFLRGQYRVFYRSSDASKAKPRSLRVEVSRDRGRVRVLARKKVPVSR